MFGLDNKSGINVMPPMAPADSQTPLWFTEGGAGLAATYPGQEWFNQIQAELLNILIAAEITPQKDNLGQLSSAISKLASAYALSVVHVTGTSATAVMSQKGVSQALDQKASVFSLAGKIDNTSVTNDPGTSSSLIMSQKGVTENCVPVGTVIFVSHSKSVTGRFLKTVGTAVSRTVYAGLFAEIGTTYGAGDGSTTFNLPDTRDEFPRFGGDNRAVGSKQGDATRNFTGTVSARTATNSARIFSKDTAGVFTSSGTDGAMLENGTATSPLPADRLTTLNIDGGRQLPIADEIRPRNMAFAGWIKY